MTQHNKSGANEVRCDVDVMLHERTPQCVNPIPSVPAPVADAGVTEKKIRPCLCGQDACIGASNLRPFYRCVRDVGEADIADMSAIEDDAGVKRPELPGVGEFMRNVWEAHRVAREIFAALESENTTLRTRHHNLGVAYEEVLCKLLTTQDALRAIVRYRDDMYADTENPPQGEDLRHFTEKRHELWSRASAALSSAASGKDGE